MTHIIRYMLVYENDSDIISLGKGFQCTFNDLWLSVLLYGEEITRVGCSVSDSCKEEASDGVLIIVICFGHTGRTMAKTIEHKLNTASYEGTLKNPYSIKKQIDLPHASFNIPHPQLLL